MITLLNEETLKNQIYYSHWHRCGRRIDNNFNSYYDIILAEPLGPILEASKDGTSFIICTYLTELVDLDYTKYTEQNEFKIWDRDPGSIGLLYLENTKTGIRYNGYYESLFDKGDEGLKVVGSNCAFTETIDDGLIETWCALVKLYQNEMDVRDIDSKLDMTNVETFLKDFEDYMRENHPDRVLELDYQ